MKAKANVIRVPAVIDKGGLAAVREHYGQSNATRFLDHASATLWLESFVGRYDVDRRKFAGHYVFVVRPDPVASEDGVPGFVSLPGMELPTDSASGARFANTDGTRRGASTTDKKKKLNPTAKAVEEVTTDG